jgi:hypothetical protein
VAAKHKDSPPNAICLKAEAHHYALSQGAQLPPHRTGVDPGALGAAGVAYRLSVGRHLRFPPGNGAQ